MADSDKQVDVEGTADDDGSFDDSDNMSREALAAVDRREVERQVGFCGITHIPLCIQSYCFYDWTFPK